MEGRKPQVYSIAAHRGFADALVAGLVPRYSDPEVGLARLTLLLPSTRAVPSGRTRSPVVFVTPRTVLAVVTIWSRLASVLSAMRAAVLTASPNTSLASISASP